MDLSTKPPVVPVERAAAVAKVNEHLVEANRLSKFAAGLHDGGARPRPATPAASATCRSLARADRRWPACGRVPSILGLAQNHGVSHRTAAHALNTLRDEGLIISVRGKGYYVASTSARS
jgi:hypothetical protein